MGLFSDIWDWMKSKVEGLINAALTKFKSWVNGAIKAAINAVDWVITNVSEFIDNSIHYIDESLNYWGDQITQFIDNSIHYVDESIHYWGDQVTQYVTNVVNNVTNYVTNVTKVFKTYVTNVTGTTTEWVMGYIAKIIPADFIRDPWGYLLAAFNKFVDVWVHGLVKDFGEGLYAGATEEEPGIHGAGESFMRGFNEVVNEEK